MPAFGSVLSPDLSELYFMPDVNGYEEPDILVSRKVDEVWTPPRPASFDGAFADGDMALSPDGKSFFLFRYDLDRQFPLIQCPFRQPKASRGRKECDVHWL